MKQLLRHIFLSFALVALSFFAVPKVALAGTNLTLTCNNEGPCAISPNQPLFNENNVAPGQSLTQTLTVVNNDSDDTCALAVKLNETSTPSTVNLATRMFAAITDSTTTIQGGVTGGKANNTLSYAQLYAMPQFSAGSIPPSSSKVFTWYATFDPTVGNEYQNVSTVFDIELTAECSGGTTPTPPPNTPPPGGSVNGSTTQAQPPVCSATAPTVAPTITSITTGVNTATLTWTAVPGADHYAIFFTRNDGVQYGASNIGNVTSYTITNLSGNSATYTFQVMGVNDCAPGPRSGEANSGAVAGAFIQGRPIGPEGEVLGVQEEVPAPTEIQVGQVEGASTEMCTAKYWYLAYLLLIIQAVFVIVTVMRMKNRTRMWLLVAFETILSIILFYWLRECDCTNITGILSWLCKWFWVVSVLESILILIGKKLLIKEHDYFAKK